MTATTPLDLLAIAIAGRKSGDRQLERSALRELQHAHGIRLGFIGRRWPQNPVPQQPQPPQEVADE